MIHFSLYFSTKVAHQIVVRLELFMFGVATFLGEEELFEGLVIVLVSYDGLEEFFVDHE